MVLKLIQLGSQTYFQLSALVRSNLTNVYTKKPHTDANIFVSGVCI